MRYRFGEFVVSVRQRQLFKNGRSLPLIPRYFDLLVLLIQRRHAAVSRRDIFDSVWTDVIVSDGALSQAIRILRRTLGDDSREPVFIRTVSRHGYSFVFADVIEESDTTPLDSAVATSIVSSPTTAPAADGDELDALIERLLDPAGTVTDEDRRDAAERLHLLGTARAMERLLAKPGHAKGLALLRDARWSIEEAGDVPLFRQPEGFAAARELILLRGREAFRLVERRSISAALGAAAAGAVAGGIGGSVLVLSPASQAPFTVVAVFGLIGAVTGAAAGGGIGAGIAAAEALARSRRSAAIVAGAALGGFVIGLIGHLAARWTLEGLFGLRLGDIGGPLEGVVLGAAAGLGYAATTRRPGEGGMATPVGSARLLTSLVVAICMAAAGLALSITGHPMIGGLINEIAQASSGSQVALTPLGSLYNEPSFGRGTKALLAMFESGLFGLGLTAGLTRRPPR